MKIIFLFLVLFTMPFQSCSTSQKMADNQTGSGHFRLYTYPDKINIQKFDEQRYKKLVFISSNDFDGNIFPTNYPIKNRFGENRVLRVGGLSAMRAYYDLFKKEFKESLVYVDAGSFLNSQQDHDYTIFLYNYLNVDVATLGLNEFKLNSKGPDYGQYLASLTKQSKFDIVNSNLFDLKTAEPVKWDGISDIKIKDINGVKIGFLGIFSQKSAQSIPDNSINGLYFQNLPRSIITKARILRRRGAQVIVLLTNATVDCSSMMAHEEDLPPEKVNFIPSKSNHCNVYENELYTTLGQLPKKTVDLVITSGTNQKVANYLHGYPIIQNPGHGKYFSWADLYFDTKLNRVVANKTFIHQPVNLCHSFLKDSQDCYTLEGTEHQDLIPATFLGHPVEIRPLPKKN